MNFIYTTQQNEKEDTGRFRVDFSFRCAVVVVAAATAAAAVIVVFKIVERRRRFRLQHWKYERFREKGFF